MVAWLDQRFPNFFERVQNLSLVNTSRSKPQTTYEKNDCLDEFWQQVAKFIFDVSNLLFSQVPTLYRQTQTSSGNVEYTVKYTTQVWITFARPIFDPSPFFVVCKSEARVVQTNQPQSQWRPRSLLAQLQYWLKKNTVQILHL